MPGGVSQVRTCTDALVGLAKAEGAAMLLTGHVTKDGDLAGPRALEHAVDTVLTFDGIRVRACGCSPPVARIGSAPKARAHGSR